MTIEEAFFKAFNIKPQIYKSPGREYTSDGELCSWYEEKIFPEITAEILLKMICIFNRTQLYCAMNLADKNYNALKNTILSKMILITKNYFLKSEIRKDFINEVKALFEGDENVDF